MLVLISLFAQFAVAGSSPELKAVSPRGVQRGAEHTLKLTGVRLDGAKEVFFYDQGITTKSVEVVKPNELKVVVDVAEDCALGQHVLQVHGDQGLSDFRIIYVGPFPAIAEVEPNNSFDVAQRIEFKHTATGQIAAEDKDYFVVALKAGQRLSVEVEAIRLGTYFDSVVTVYDPQKKAIATSDDTKLHHQDGYITINAPVDGDYYVMIRDTVFNANPAGAYRIHIGDFIRPDVLFPPGGKPGGKLKVEMLSGRSQKPPALENKSREIQIPGDEEGSVTKVFADGPSSLPLRINELDNFNLPADAKNIKHEDALPVELPVAINGRIAQGHQYQFYKFAAKKGNKVSIEVFANRIGSAMDPFINVYDAKRKSLIGNDDGAVRPDSSLVFTPPSDGDFTLRIFDLLKRDGDDIVYRIELKPVTPKLSFGIKRNDRFSQKRMAMAVPKGGRFAAIVTAKWQAFSQDVQVEFEGLPDGVTATTLPLKKNVTELPVVFEATQDAVVDFALVTVKASPIVETKDEKASETEVETEAADAKPAAQPEPKLDSEITLTSLDSLGQPNNTSYQTTTVDKLAVGVVDALPFRIELQPVDAPLVRNGSAKLKIVAHRDEGFKEKITVQFPYRPAGVSSTSQIQIKPDQTEIEYPINANKGAQLGEWPIYIIGTANVNGPAWTSSKLETIRVEEPFVAMESERSVGERNDTMKVVCQIEQLRDFDGEATAELKGLPPHVTMTEPQRFTKTDETITFEIKTNDKSPYGQHRGVFVEVSVPVGKGQSVARAGQVIVQINKPLKQEPKVAMQEAVK